MSDVLRSLIEIALFTVMIYGIISFARGTGGAGLLAGFGLFFLLFYVILRAVAAALELEAVNLVFEESAAVIVMGTVVIFQPEIRRGLGRLVQNPLVERMLGAKRTAVDELVRAVERLQSRRIGALIAIERNFGLGDYVARGAPLDCLVTAELLEALFVKDGPLHDGALVIRRDRIVAGRCEFPLSTNAEVARRHGMRHRAALGVTEENDAVTVVVSEETGAISACHAGEMLEGLSSADLRVFLEEHMSPPAVRGGREERMHRLREKTTTIIRPTHKGAGSASASAPASVAAPSAAEDRAGGSP